MLKQSFTDLVTKLEQETPSNNNVELIATLKGRISMVEGELEAKKQQRKNASELAGNAPSRGRGEEAAVPLPAMFAGIIGNGTSDNTRGDR